MPAQLLLPLDDAALDRLHRFELPAQLLLALVALLVGLGALPRGAIRLLDDTVELPPEWAKFAKPSPKPFAVDPDDVAAHRTEWLREWREIATR